MSTSPTATRAPALDTILRGFLVGGFGISWVLWTPAGLDLRGSINLPLPLPLPPTLLVVLGSFGPMLAALAVTARHGGWAAVKELLGRLRFRGVAGRWFVLALVLGSVTVVPALVHLFTGGSTDADAVASHLAAVPLHFFVVSTVGGGLDEELGWRGVAQPQLQLRMSPVPANLLLGLVWAAWHLPLWSDPDSTRAAYPFVVYAVVIVGHSLVTGYLYNASGGSLLIAVLVHGMNDTGDGIRYAVLGQAGDALGWQLLLAAASLALGAAFCLHTRGRLGLPAGPVEAPDSRPGLVDGVDPNLTARDVLSRRPGRRPQACHDVPAPQVNQPVETSAPHPQHQGSTTVIRSVPQQPPAPQQPTEEMLVPQFFIRQQVTVMVNRYEIRAANPDGSEGHLLGFAEQKRLKLKEEVTFFADESRTRPVFSFKARQRLDVHAEHDVFDEYGQPLGYFRKDFAASLLRSTWDLHAPGVDAVGRERRPLIALLRRFWRVIPWLGDIWVPFVFHFDFVDRNTGQVVLASERQKAIRDRYTVTVPDLRLDFRVAAAMAVALDALQSR